VIAHEGRPITCKNLIGARLEALKTGGARPRIRYPMSHQLRVELQGRLLGRAFWGHTGAVALKKIDDSDLTGGGFPVSPKLTPSATDCAPGHANS